MINNHTFITTNIHYTFYNFLRTVAQVTYVTERTLASHTTLTDVSACSAIFTRNIDALFQTCSSNKGPYLSV